MNRYVLMGLACVILSGCADVPEGTRDGQRAAGIEGETAKGEPISLADYKGKVVVVDFWATWCRPCVALLPHTAQLAKEYKGRPVQFLGVSLDNERERLEEFLARNQYVTWPNIFDGPSGPIAETWKVSSIPRLVVIDHEGIVRHRDVNPEDLGDILAKMVPLAESH